MAINPRNEHIGEMRQKVQMLKNVPTDTDSGGAIDHYGIIVTTRGRLRKLSGRRDLSFADIVNAETYELFMRCQTDVTNNMRIDAKFLIGGLVYTLQTWELVDEIKFYYRLRLGIHKDGSVTVDAPSPIPSDSGVLAVWLTTTAGVSSVFSSLLIGKTILGVERSGIGYTLITGTPVNQEVAVSAGTVTFDVLNPFNAGEIVYVLYKTGS